MEYTFHLRPDVKFHNGRALVSDDVKYSVERVLAKETAAPYRSYFDPVDKIETPDKATAKFHLKFPYTPFIGGIAIKRSSSVVPQEVVEKQKDLSTVAVGAGPWTLGDWVQNDRITMNRFADYYVPCVARGGRKRICAAARHHRHARSSVQPDRFEHPRPPRACPRRAKERNARGEAAIIPDLLSAGMAVTALGGHPTQFAPFGVLFMATISPVIDPAPQSDANAQLFMQARGIRRLRRSKQARTDLRTCSSTNRRTPGSRSYSPLAAFS